MANSSLRTFAKCTFCGKQKSHPLAFKAVCAVNVISVGSD